PNKLDKPPMPAVEPAWAAPLPPEAPVIPMSMLAGEVVPEVVPEAAADVPVPTAVEDSPDEGGGGAIGWASPCSVCGTVDSDDERCPEREDATVCTCVAAELPAACATEAA